LEANFLLGTFRRFWITALFLQIYPGKFPFLATCSIHYATGLFAFGGSQRGGEDQREFLLVTAPSGEKKQV
jgi:hypothetical protein